MNFPLDNTSRKSKGRPTSVIHDSTGKIVMSVCRVQLARRKDEPIKAWLLREEEATQERATSVVRMMNACWLMQRTLDKHGAEEQAWLPNVIDASVGAAIDMSAKFETENEAED